MPKRLHAARSTAGVLAGLALAALIIAGSGALSRREAQIERQDAELSDALLSLSRAAGFGGFIHNFKTYISRPDEVRFRVDAAAELAEMGAQLDRLEALARSRDAQYDLEKLRDVVAKFRTALDRVDALVGTGLDAREIDRQVRIEERPATAEIDRIAADIRARLARANDRAQTQRSMLGTLFAFLALFAYAALGQTVMRLRAERDRVRLERDLATLRTGRASD